MRCCQQKINLPIVGGSAGYVIPDFAKALGDMPKGRAVDLLRQLRFDTAATERYRKRFNAFMVHEALEHAVSLDVLAQSINAAKSAKPEDITQALRANTFTQGWAKAMTNGKVKFDDSGLNIHAEPVMVQWQGTELVTVWPQRFAKAKFITRKVAEATARGFARAISSIRMGRRRRRRCDQRQAWPLWHITSTLVLLSM